MTAGDEANKSWDEASNAQNVNQISTNPAYIGVRGGIGDPKPNVPNEQSGPKKEATPLGRRCECNKIYAMSFRSILRLLIIVSISFEFVFMNRRINYLFFKI